MTILIPTLPRPDGAVENADRILSTMGSGISDNTRRVYGNALRTVEKFYAERGWDFYPAGTDDRFDEERFVAQVLSYLQALSDAGRKSSTLTLHLSAVKYRCGFENQRALGSLSTKPVSAFMDGIARSSARTHTPKQAQALSIQQIRAIYRTLDTNTPRGRRDRALIALGLATAMRSQSLADLTLSDISPAVTIDGITVRVRHSKTDQKGKGVIIPVARSSKKKLDPVAALQSWLETLAAYGFTRESHPDMPFFPAIRGSRGIQTTPMQQPNLTITGIIRNGLVDAEVCTPDEAMAFSSHSLRASFITLSNIAGVPERDIAAITGHKSMTVLRGYDRTSVERSAQTAYLG
jgi:integrase